MLKMLIRMDEKKITEEKTYKLESIYQTLDRLFAKYGLLRMEDTSGARVYRDSGNENDFAYFGIVLNILSDQSWFMNNAVEWMFYESDGYLDAPEHFNEENFLRNYRQAMRA